MNIRKKICFVVSSPSTAKVFLLKHFEYLSKEFDVYLVANFDEEKYFFESKHVKQVENIKIVRGISIIDDFKAIFSLRKYFKENKFDAVQSITPKAGLVAMVASKLANIKIRIHIFTGQVWHTKSGVFKYILMQIDKLIVFCSTDILVDGECQRQFLIQNKIINQNSKVLGKGSISGADEKFFTPDNSMYKEYRDKLGIKDEVVFLYLARITYDKGAIDIAKAFVKLNSKYSNSKLLIIGPDEDNIVSNILEITNNKNVIIQGATNKLLECLQMADVLCLPSYREGFGTVVIQASLLEKPIICSDTYGLMETIIDGETGLRHKVGDIDSISAQMEKFMDLELRTSLGKNGRKYVVDNFSATTISEKWLEYYTSKLT